MTSPIRPGLLILHGNRLESLRDAVFDWIGRTPLAPLEEETFLVQSNGAAEWLKMSLARTHGICAATRVELPGRFFWRAYRQVLGRDRIPPRSVLEKDALTWRLMRLLPELLGRAAFEPVAAFLADGDPSRRLQLARQLAALYDQYQVYRADWLDDWERARPVIVDGLGRERPLAADQRWQMALWRAIVDELTRDDRWSIRPRVHRAFVDALATDEATAEALPRRVVLFGASHVSMQGLQALAALSSRVQVILAIPDPCRFHWADIIEGREALRTARRRHPSAREIDLADVPFDAMHLHAHPLLAAWGRQGRDFMRLLDAFDDADARRRFDVPKIDLFDDGPGTTLLEQVQACIRDLVPQADHPVRTVADDDRSIVFEVAHGPQREVEILHDRLLALFGGGGERPLRPRDVIVMVPDIEVFAPAIRAVFGQHRRDDPRFVPFDIADLQSRGSNPLVVAVEWLLRVAEKRFRLQEIRDLLDVPAVAARFDIAPDRLPRLFAWLEGAGVRWGLHAGQRTRLGFEAVGEQNSWLFGLRRLLLGYATGPASLFDGIAPYDEIGGLDAAVVGSIVDLLDRLDAWWSSVDGDATPVEWAARGRGLLATFTTATDERERLTIAALQTALATWLDACDIARFVEPVPLAVFREGWLAGIEGLDASRRFLTGGVTFCTLMPLRSVPFEVVCLLGMNDGDFPRQGRRDDFDLMALAGQQRPGDRSRRDDDRYLMLEALLSARRVLSISWSGRSPRDNSAQPPSVLVSQLRDYLDASWLGTDARAITSSRTTEHPLQPFSRRYFEGGALSTFAREWRAAHVAGAPGAFDDAVFGTTAVVFDTPLTVSRLASFLRNPVKAFFQARLQVRVGDRDEALDDDEAFDLDGLVSYELRDTALAAALREFDAADADVDESIARQLERIRASGALPMRELGAREAHAMYELLRPMLVRWQAARRRHPRRIGPLPLHLGHPLPGFDDWLGDLWTDGAETVNVTLTPSRVLEKKGDVPRPRKLLEPWVRMLVATSAGHAVRGDLIGCDGVLSWRALPRPDAERALAELVAAWRDGMAFPMPFAPMTALAQAAGQAAADVYDGGKQRDGEGREFAMNRCYPDFEALTASGRFDQAVERLFQPLAGWMRDHVRVEDAVDDGRKAA